MWSNQGKVAKKSRDRHAGGRFHNRKKNRRRGKEGKNSYCLNIMGLQKNGAGKLSLKPVYIPKIDISKSDGGALT